MNTQEKIIEAITNKKPISFKYIKPEKVQGERIGNPHAIFTFTSLNWVKSIKVHIVQTAGVSDSRIEKPFPDFRMFDLSDINDVVILNDQSVFSPDPKYNSTWDGYCDAIVKI